MNFFFIMRKCTKLFVRTLVYGFWIMGAKLFFIVGFMIKLLNARMRILTKITTWTFLFILNIRTHCCRIEVSYSFSIFSIMIINALLMVVRFGNVTRI